MTQEKYFGLLTSIYLCNMMVWMWDNAYVCKENLWKHTYLYFYLISSLLWDFGGFSYKYAYIQLYIHRYCIRIKKPTDCGCLLKNVAWFMVSREFENILKLNQQNTFIFLHRIQNSKLYEYNSILIKLHFGILLKIRFTYAYIM